MGCPRSRLLCSHVHHTRQLAAHPDRALAAAPIDLASQRRSRAQRGGAKRQPGRGQGDQRPRCDKITVAHSITSLAATSNLSGTVSPSALAVLAFTIISNLTGT